LLKYPDFFAILSTVVTSLPMMQSLHVLTCLLCLQIFNLPAEETLYLPPPTKDTHKITNTFMTVASGKNNLQSKHDLICHGESESYNVRAFYGDVIPF